MEGNNNGSKKLQIRNSTAEFLIFQIENKEEGIEVLYQDDTLWLTQNAIAVLFDKGRSTIAEHLQNIKWTCRSNSVFRPTPPASCQRPAAA